MNYSRNFINLIVKEGDEEEWRLTCYYGFPERGRRRQAWHRKINVGFIHTQIGCVMGSEMRCVIVTCQIFFWKDTPLLGSNIEVPPMLLKNGLTGPWLTPYGWHAILMSS
jgi:hypothetical protein